MNRIFVAGTILLLGCAAGIGGFTLVTGHRPAQAVASGQPGETRLRLDRLLRADAFDAAAILQALDLMDLDDSTRMTLRTLTEAAAVDPALVPTAIARTRAVLDF